MNQLLAENKAHAGNESWKELGLEDWENATGPLQFSLYNVT